MTCNCHKFLIFLFVSLFMQSKLSFAEHKQKNQNVILNDTIILKTKQVKGYAHMSRSIYGIELLDPKVKEYFPIKYPQNISSLKVGIELADFKPYWYSKLKKDKSDYLQSFLKKYYPGKIDTANIPTLKANSIVILSGLSFGKEVFIVDQNNNKDLTDDQIWPSRPIDTKWNSTIIECKYNIFDGKETTEDSGWINIGTNKMNVLSLSIGCHLESTVTIDKSQYTFGIVNESPINRFSYDSPVLAILSKDNSSRKDSILRSEMIELGENIKLGNNYYRFADITNDGKYISLIKEKDTNNLIGCQVGMMAPDFECHAVGNDTLSLKNYKGKYLLIANLTADSSPKSNYQYYTELHKQYANKLEILGIDFASQDFEKNSQTFDLTGKFIMAEGNISIQKTYRKDHFSKVCFLINPEGRIVEKFDISQWEQTLQKYF